MSTVIFIYSLFVHLSSGCASITLRGIPFFPLHVCVGSKQFNETTYYFQYICDNTESIALISVHNNSLCSGEPLIEAPMPMGNAEEINCEHIYNCSYAVCRKYNDSTKQCQHSKEIAYHEFAIIVDECGYDPHSSGSIMHSCDEYGIYHNIDIGDTQGLCKDTVKEPFIEAGCNEVEGQYYEIIKCLYRDKPTSVPQTEILSIVAIICIVVVIVMILLLSIFIVYMYSVVAKEKATKPTTDVNLNVSAEEIGCVATQKSSPPSAPPKSENVPLIKENKCVIREWLLQNTEISEVDTIKYANILIENGFDDFKLLTEITMNDLDVIGIAKLGHRKAIIKAIDIQTHKLQSSTK